MIFIPSLNTMALLLTSSCASTSQQNGRAKHKFRHILDIVHALFLSIFTPISFWGKPLSQLSTRSIGCLPISLIIVLLSRSYFALSHNITIFVFLVLPILFYSNPMSAPNSSLVLGCVVFLDMEWNKTAISVMIPCLAVFSSPVM